MALIVRHLGSVEYSQSLSIQEELLSRKFAGDADDYLLILEHPPVYTLGRGADEADLQGAPERLGVPAIRTGRGGGATFHGPGQLVAYPILSLSRPERDVHRYVRNLESVLIRTCDIFGVAGGVCEGAPGVWVDGAKIASIGVGLRRWTTFHGVALNVNTDLVHFASIVTCRMPNLRLTSLEQCLGKALSMAEVSRVFVESFCATFWRFPLSECA